MLQDIEPGCCGVQITREQWSHIQAAFGLYAPALRVDESRVAEGTEAWIPVLCSDPDILHAQASTVSLPCILIYENCD